MSRVVWCVVVATFAAVINISTASRRHIISPDDGSLAPITVSSRCMPRAVRGGERAFPAFSHLLRGHPEPCLSDFLHHSGYYFCFVAELSEGNSSGTMREDIYQDQGFVFNKGGLPMRATWEWQLCSMNRSTGVWALLISCLVSHTLPY